ncbi:peptidase inhibitor clitocypin protein [Rhizoctonia solani AG-3 Rhs1AP]|uniref:Peptidase inhibitor clitocypin protein n=2 Tax=Rhizoctonia solani AG-3 TaxID=1086053 RepID=A0A074RGU9_9AGAM|nr:peptidase inhibitor clitocypin protein [Rhizoctonia solani AG-3 Rhs1AP]KEP46331.1 peptidase inhibitor clitocypin protein [Rhizoctonia solani 123E]
MSLPQAGFYNLRITSSNDPGISPVGGMYATGQTTGNVVRLAALGNVNPEDRQVWQVDYTGEDTIIIQAAGTNDPMTFMHCNQVEDGEPIILGRPTAFTANRIQNEAGLDVISLTLKRTGVVFYAGQNQDNIMVLTADPEVDIPAWLFVSTSPE